MNNSRSLTNHKPLFGLKLESITIYKFKDTLFSKKKKEIDDGGVVCARVYWSRSVSPRSQFLLSRSHSTCCHSITQFLWICWMVDQDLNAAAI
nr:hypothetical protein CFP56_13562 [Quercus suber]